MIGMTDILRELVSLPGDGDVRQYLKENYGVRQVLKNAKLL